MSSNSSKQLDLTVKQRVWIKFGTAEGKEIGRVIIELYNDLLPKTCENFRALCTGEKGEGKSGQQLMYANTVLHKISTGFAICGGDITRSNGTGGESIYGRTFDDENLTAIKHDRRGIVSMSNVGKNTNGSQFFITHVATPWLDDAHTIFGAVQSDADQDIVNEIAQGDVIESVTIEGDAAALLASIEQVADWNEAMGDA